MKLRIRGNEIFSSIYTKEWLDSGHEQQLDPALQYILVCNIQMLIKIISEYLWIHRLIVGECYLWAE
ncbi:MAG TPA: hypothetical protein VMU83_20165 [Hanamia sp.]|nr:hypothetical protein [Hanamia sp.]